MRYVLARLKIEQREKAYRFYITDALKIIGGLNIRYADIVGPAQSDPRGAEQIKSDITAKLRKMQKKG